MGKKAKSTRRSKSPEGDRLKLDIYDLRTLGIGECPSFQSVRSKDSLGVGEMHTHGDRLEVNYLAAGRRTYTDGQRDCILHGGSVWINPPGRPHTSQSRPSGASRYYCFELSAPQPGVVWCGLAPEQAAEAWALLTASDIGRLGKALYGMESRFESFFEHLAAYRKPPYDPVFLLGVRMSFNAIVAYCCESLFCTDVAQPSKRFRELLKCIDDSDPHEMLEVQDLAKRFGFNVSYFVQMFNRQVGVSPGRYVLARRLESAARRIVSGVEIGQVATEYHFSSRQHFSAAFKTYFLETPTAYRQRVLGQQQGEP